MVYLVMMSALMVLAIVGVVEVARAEHALEAANGCTRVGSPENLGSIIERNNTGVNK